MTELEIAELLRTSLVAFLLDERRKAKSGKPYALTMTYAELIRRSGVRVIPIGLGRYLTMVGKQCANRNEPMLDTLVVSSRTKRPGRAFRGGEFDEEEWQRDVEACHRYLDYGY